jgi:hypothetical protein
VLVLPNSGQVGGSSGNDNALFLLQVPGPILQKFDVRLCMCSRGFWFLIPVHPMRLHRCNVFASLRHDFLSPPFHLHVDRGLVIHGYPWSPPTRVLEVLIKWTRPSRSPADLQVGPKTLSTISATMEDLGRPYPDRRRPAGLEEQASP